MFINHVYHVLCLVVCMTDTWCSQSYVYRSSKTACNPDLRRICHFLSIDDRLSQMTPPPPSRNVSPSPVFLVDLASATKLQMLTGATNLVSRTRAHALLSQHLPKPRIPVCLRLNSIILPHIAPPMRTNDSSF